MVRRVALKGYRVAPVFTQEDFAELMEARLAIEPVNARLACERINQHGLAELGKAVENLKSAPRGPSFAEFKDYLEADERFHQLIARQPETSLWRPPTQPSGDRSNGSDSSVALALPMPSTPSRNTRQSWLPLPPAIPTKQLQPGGPHPQGRFPGHCRRPGKLIPALCR